ncbi:hypothetical protein Dimus_016049 [Dionaea muscipula]
MVGFSHIMHFIVFMIFLVFYVVGMLRFLQFWLLISGIILLPRTIFIIEQNFSSRLASYEMKVAYPSYEDSDRIALGNILKFRKKNWQFDIIVDKVPKEWKLDPKWDGEPKQPHQMSHRRKYPSKWRAAVANQDPLATVKLVDQFVIKRTENAQLQNNGPTIS